MDRPHFRPRFILLFPGDVAAVREAIAERVASRPGCYDGRVRRQSALVTVAAEMRHPWSPALEVVFREHPDGTLLVGRFGPAPALMTAYAFGTIGLGFLVCLSASWAYVQSIMGESPRCLMGTAGALVGLAAIWGSSRVGATWARDQMHLLAWVIEDLGALRDDEAELLAVADAHREALRRAASPACLAADEPR